VVLVGAVVSLTYGNKIAEDATKTNKVEGTQ